MATTMPIGGASSPSELASERRRSRAQMARPPRMKTICATISIVMSTRVEAKGGALAIPRKVSGTRADHHAAELRERQHVAGGNRARRAPRRTLRPCSDACGGTRTSHAVPSSTKFASSVKTQQRKAAPADGRSMPTMRVETNGAKTRYAAPSNPNQRSENGTCAEWNAQRASLTPALACA